MEKVEGQNIDLRVKVASLVEAGFNEEAVAMYGTSVENMLKIISSGKIPPKDLSQEQLPYQTELTDGGKNNLYYLLMVGARIKELKPDLFAKVCEGQDPVYIENFLLSNDHALKNARIYARWQAVEDYFKQRTGVFLNSEQIEEMQRMFKDLDPKEITRVLAPTAADALTKAFNRRGVIIYFNRSIFDLAKVSPGVEDEQELTAVSDDILDASVICGIEPLSDGEKEEVLAA